MSFVFGITLLVLGIAFVAIAVQLFLHDKHSYAHNHKITGSLSNAIAGSMNESAATSPDELSKGFTIDTRTGELVPCNQLSRESIN